MNAYELADEMNKPVENTDKEIWREIEGEYYCSRILVTEKGCIGIDVGGHIYVKTVDEWHKQADRIAGLEKRLEENKHTILRLEKYLTEYRDREDDWIYPHEKPLSDEEIIKIFNQIWVDGGNTNGVMHRFARAIEAKVRGEK